MALEYKFNPFTENMDLVDVIADTVKEKAANFIIIEDGDDYVAINGNTSAEASRDEDFYTVIAAIIAADMWIHIKITSEILVTDTITLADDLLITGVSWGTLLTLANATNKSIFQSTANNSFSIKDMMLNGNKANQTVATPVIDIYQGYDWVLENLFVTLSKGCAVEVGDAGAAQASWTGSLWKCALEYSDQQGLLITRGSNTDLIKCTLAHNIGYNLEVICGNPRVIDNFIDLDYGGGIKFGSGTGSSSGIFSANWITNPDHDQYAFEFASGATNDPSDVSITGNYIQAGTAFHDTSGSWRRVTIANNIIDATTPLTLPFGASSEISIINNTGLNPIGLYAYPFWGTYGINLYSDWQTDPIANTDYDVRISPIRLISTGGTGVDIIIEDGSGNQISNPGATCDEYIPLGWVINFGAFTVAPTVKVYFS